MTLRREPFHRLWEPLAVKHQPPTPYAAKFSTPFCMALGFFERGAGLAQFGEKQIRDPEMLRLASKIRYQIDPKDEYPRNFTGHLRATLVDGTEREFRQPYLRGGQHEPLLGVGAGKEVHRQRRARWMESTVGGRVHSTVA